MCRFLAQHHLTFGASRFALPSRPVPLLIQTAGVRASSFPAFFRSREPIVMKQWLRSSASGCCNSQKMPSGSVNGVRCEARIAGSASSGLQLAMESPRSTSWSK